MRRPARWSRSALAGVVGLIAVLAAILHVAATGKGAGVWPDSVTYIQSARNLVEHHRFSTAIDARSHLIKPGDFPPLYPLVLAVPGRLGADVVDGARWLQTLFLAVTCALFGALLHRFARPWAVLVGVALLVVSSGFLVEINGFILSDSLFLCLTLLTLLLLLDWLQRPDGEPADGVHRLVLAGLVAGAAVDTRFVGIALSATVLIAAAWLDRRRSVAAVVLAAAGCAAPVVAWQLADDRLGASAGIGERVVALHPPGLDAVLDTLFTTGSWVLPGRLADGLPRIVAEVVGAAAVAGSAALVLGLLRGVGPFRAAGPAATRRAQRTGTAPLDGVGLLTRVITTLVVLHLAVVVGTVTWLDAAVPFDRRILLPVFVTGLVLAMVAADVATDGRAPSRRFAATGTVLAVALLANGAATGLDVADARRNGLGFTSVEFRCSPLVAAVRQRREDVGVYSNAPGALFILTGARAQAITPSRYGNGSGPNPGFAAGMAKMRERVHRGRSIVVEFSSVERPFSPDGAELRRVIGEAPLVTAADGVLFGRPVAFAGGLRHEGCRVGTVTSFRAERPPD